jgi:hypothetical protein
VFTDKLGTYTGEPAKLKLKENVIPKYCKPRPLLFSLKDKVEKELDRLVQEGILTPVQTSEWGTPLVPVLKPNGSLRLCGDYKITLNPYLEIDRHPKPRIEDLIANLLKGKIFSKIDLSQAYTQVLLHEESKKYCTISTTKGLYVYNRVPYGIASAPGLFQRIMEQILSGVIGVSTFLDDVVIISDNHDQHLSILKEVCSR